MALVDEFGLPVTLDSAPALAAWNDTVHGVLAHSATTPCALSTVRDEAPEFVLGHAMRGLCCQILARSELVPIAWYDLENARAAHHANPATPREAAYIDALANWLEGRPSAAIACMDRVVDEWPDDALALKIGHAIRFMMGDPAGMRRSAVRALERCAPDHPATGYMWGCYAFALEETGDFEGAERAGRRGLELASDDVWGLHAVDHVYDMTGRADLGIEWITGHPQSWDGANNFRFHVWWHLALHHLELGDVDRVIELYDTEIRSERTDDFRDVANGASLLARLEIEGIDVGDRWDELADIAARRIDDSSLVFAELHYLMALFGAGRTGEAHALVARLTRDALNGTSEMDAVALHTGIAAARGLEAFWTDDPRAALEHLLKARARFQELGGSHAQRDVFERLTIEAALRAGRHATARSLIDDRTRHRGGTDRFAHSRRAAADASASCPPAVAPHAVALSAVE